MATWREDIIKAIGSKGGVATLSEIYSLVKSYRTSVSSGYKSTVRGTIEAASSDSKVWDRKNDVFYSVEGIGGGVWGLRSTQKETPLAVDILDPNIQGGSPTPGVTVVQIYRVIRDTKLCREIKKLYDYKCQLCGLTIELPLGGNYAEAHHIVPLGAGHNGPDTADNIIVVCPNHHAMLDYGVIKLELSGIAHQGNHQISLQAINYHNSKIWQKPETIA